MESIIKQISRTSIKNWNRFCFFIIFLFEIQTTFAIRSDSSKMKRFAYDFVHQTALLGLLLYERLTFLHISVTFLSLSLLLLLFRSFSRLVSIDLQLFVHSWLTTNKYCFDWKLINLDLVFFRSIEKCAYFAHLRSNLCCECECARLVFVICTKPIGEYHANDGFNRWAKCISLRPMHCNTQIDRTY